MKALVAVLLFVVPALAQSNRNLDQIQAACGPANAQFEAQTFQSLPTAGPDRGEALVYVVEDYPQRELINPTVRVGIDGGWKGATRANSYLYFSVDPGEHHLCANWQSSLKRFSQLTALARLTAEPGQTYYFRARITFPFGARENANLDLDRIDPDEGSFLVSSFSLSKSHPKK